MESNGFKRLAVDAVSLAFAQEVDEFIEVVSENCGAMSNRDANVFVYFYAALRLLPVLNSDKNGFGECLAMFCGDLNKRGVELNPEMLKAMTNELQKASPRFSSVANNNLTKRIDPVQQVWLDTFVVELSKKQHRSPRMFGYWMSQKEWT